MEAAQPADLAALVVRWHNRHPLAKRITAAQVAGEGVVVLPYLPGRWLHGRLKRAFDETLIDALHAEQLARFGRQAGSVERPGPADWPERRVSLRAGADPAAVTWRHLYTAAIEVGGTRRRVLVGTGPKGPVIGARLWSAQRRRWAAGGLGGLALAAAAWVTSGFGTWGPGAGQEVAAGAATAASGIVREALALAGPASAARVMVPLPAASSSRSLAASPVLAASVPVTSPAASGAVAVAAAGAPASAARPAPPSTNAPASAPPLSTTTTAAAAGSASGAASQPPGGTMATPRGILPLLSPEQRQQARTESAALRAAQAASAAAADPAQALSNAAAGQVFAVATPPNRTRAGAQLRIVLMNAPTTADGSRPRAEVLQVGDGWRAVIWPYTDRASAERTRELLVARGIPAEVIAF